MDGKYEVNVTLSKNSDYIHKRRYELQKISYSMFCNS